MLRSAQYDKVIPVVAGLYAADDCHSERSEGSDAWGPEMLRFAQYDRAVPC